MKQFWINLPLKNIEKSKAFFTALGFTFNPNQGNGLNSACLMIGEKNVVCMLFDEPALKQCISGADLSTNTTEVLLSIDGKVKKK